MVNRFLVILSIFAFLPVLHGSDVAPYTADIIFLIEFAPLEEKPPGAQPPELYRSVSSQGTTSLLIWWMTWYTTRLYDYAVEKTINVRFGMFDLDLNAVRARTVFGIKQFSKADAGRCHGAPERIRRQRDRYGKEEELVRTVRDKINNDPGNRPTVPDILVWHAPFASQFNAKPDPMKRLRDITNGPEMVMALSTYDKEDNGAEYIWAYVKTEKKETTLDGPWWRMHDKDEVKEFIKQTFAVLSNCTVSAHYSECYYDENGKCLANTSCSSFGSTANCPTGKIADGVQCNHPPEECERLCKQSSVALPCSVSCGWGTNDIIPSRKNCPHSKEN